MSDHHHGSYSGLEAQNTVAMQNMNAVVNGLNQSTGLNPHDNEDTRIENWAKQHCIEHILPCLMDAGYNTLRVLAEIDDK